MPVPKPPITWIGTAGQNTWKGAGQHPKVAIVLHIAQGSLSGIDSWFSDIRAQASANYAVGLDGTIHCYVDPASGEAPFANGIVQAPDATFQQLAAAHPSNPNYWTISVEHEGFSGKPLTAAQLHASAWLTAWLCDVFKIPADEAHLLGHMEIDSVTRAQCPGWDRNGWVTYEAAVSAFLAAPPQPTPVLAAYHAVQLAVAQLGQALTPSVAAVPDAFWPGAPGEG